LLLGAVILRPAVLDALAGLLHAAQLMHLGIAGTTEIDHIGEVAIG
jgi:hypothetical protein